MELREFLVCLLLQQPVIVVSYPGVVRKSMSSTISEIQKIVVSLSESDIILEPGSVGQLIVTMTNRQESSDRLMLEIEGVDVEWYRIPMPALNLAPGETSTARVNFKVPRDSSSRADTYPFLVKVQAMETGEEGLSQASLVVKPFNNLQLEMDVKRVVATFLHPLNDLEVTISNFGNAEETLELFASDPEDECVYEFDADRITLRPGQTEIIPLAVRPKNSSIVGGMRLYGFTASARSVEYSYIHANVHGQIEKRALISPLLGIFLLLLIFGGAGAWTFRPRAPIPIVINSFATPIKTVTSGQEASLSWDVSPAGSQIILYKRTGPEGEEVALGEQKNLVGSITVKPDMPFTIYKIVVREHGLPDRDQSLKIDVMPPPVPEKPVIKFFKAEPAVIHIGESAMLSWETSNAKDLILDPGDIRLSQFQQSHSVTPDQDTTYQLRAIGVDDKMKAASKNCNVRVVPKDVCTAEIHSFAGPKGDVYIGSTVRLRWRTAYAASARIDSDHGAVGDVVPSSGSQDVIVNEPTSYTFSAVDSAGNRITKTLTITPIARPIIPEAPIASPPVTPPTTSPPDTIP